VHSHLFSQALNVLCKIHQKLSRRFAKATGCVDAVPPYWQDFMHEINREYWWADDDLAYDADGQLRFGACDLSALYLELGTPAYVYSLSRVTRNVARLRAALTKSGLETRLMFAMKANRFPPVLRHLHQLGVGLDVCSPGEVRHALECGFTTDQLSFTSGSLSTSDYEALARWPGLHVNADSITAIRRIALVSPGRSIGLRINPAVGYGYANNPLVCYASHRPTKFGIYEDRFREAIATASDLGLRVVGLHCHAGCGFLNPQLPGYEAMLERMVSFLDAAPGVQLLNLGGGLGIPLKQGDQPLDLDQWSDLLRKHLDGRALSITLEPGDYLLKNAGILLAEVTQMEEKGGTVFLGVNAGFNIHPEPAHYGLPLEPVPILRREGAEVPVTVAGNINEALDVWVKDFPIPPVKEGDGMAFLNAGAYGASMASDHCLRKDMTEQILPESDSLQDLDVANRSAWESLYSSTPHLVWGTQPIAFLESYRDSLQSLIPATGRLLDAGTGEGRNLPFLLSFAPEEVLAVDASAAALDKIPPEIAANVTPIQAVLNATNLPDDHVDLALMVDVAETLPCLVSVLREMHRILKPGGYFLCNFAAQEDGVAGIEMEPADNNGFLYQGRYFFRFFERSEAIDLSRHCGFDLVECRLCVWTEYSHPGFRSEEHQHQSHVLLARKPTENP
jgi:diaminopimelate decarboxylase